MKAKAQFSNYEVTAGWLTVCDHIQYCNIYIISDSPKNTSAVVLSSDKTLEGNLVTLVCSSQASPPVLTYHWFKRETNTTVRVSVGQNYSITNVSSQHSGLYYCTALHKLGQQNSTPTFLNVLCKCTER